MTPPTARAVAVRATVHTVVSVVALAIALSALVLGLYELGHLALAPRAFGAPAFDPGTLAVVGSLALGGSLAAILLARTQRLPHLGRVRASLQANIDGRWTAIDYPWQEAPRSSEPAAVAAALLCRWLNDPDRTDAATHALRVHLLYADDTTIDLATADISASAPADAAA